MTILESLKQEGVDYPHGCATGLCSLCKSRLISGEVSHQDYYESALSKEERAAGLVLICCATPQTDCVITPVQQDANLPPVRTFDSTVIAISELTHDITRITIADASDKPYEFLPGQYSRISFGGAEARDFSMASRPGEGTVEFFVRRIPDGRVTDHALRTLVAGDRVNVRGPFGRAYLREGHIGPIIAVAGGSGLAPVWSIVTTALDRGMTQPLHVYLGVRSEQDVYMEKALVDLSTRFPNLSVSIALSEPPPGSGRRSGFLHTVLQEDFGSGNLSDWVGYVAGPPPMVDAVAATLAQLGMPGARCYTDPFLTAAAGKVQSAAGA
jgi:ferredoxin-NAD(P)+ reductase (naphthalene dioxygenase ferredoxin-specific)